MRISDWSSDVCSSDLFTYSATTQGRLPDAEAFGNVILRADENMATLRLRDVARVELGAASYSIESKLNGSPAVPIAVYPQPGANALNTMDAVKARLGEQTGRAHA